MVVNPIYNAPEYESVPPQNSALTAPGLQLTDMILTGNLACNSPTSTSTTLALQNNGNRYVDQPVRNISHLDDKSSSVNMHSESLIMSHPTDGEASISQISSASFSNTKRKAVKDRNKFHLTLSLGPNDSGTDTNVSCTTESMPEQIPMARVNPAVSRDGDDNYTTMSPVGTIASTCNTNGWDKLSPEDK